MEEDPFMGEFENLGGEREIVATESRRLLPHVSVLEKPTNGYLMPDSDFGFVSPYRGFDKAHANGMDGWATHIFAFLDSMVVEIDD